MIMIQRRVTIPLSFFLLLCYIIFLADTADYNFAFYLVGYIPYGDKIMHALLFGTMAFALNYGLTYKSIKVEMFQPTQIQLGAVIVLLFAFFEEMSQYFIPSRTFDLWDLVADGVGVILFSYWRVKC